MEVGAIFFTLAVVAVVGVFIYQPFVQSRKRRNREEEHEFSTLMAEYDRTLNALQELEFDNALGKIPSEDYPDHRLELLQRGADLLRKLDSLSESSNSNGRRPATSGADVERRVEAAVASRRADASSERPVVELSDDDLETMIAARRKARKEKSAGFCPKCGKAVLVSDRFCPACGKAIN